LFLKMGGELVLCLFEFAGTKQLLIGFLPKKSSEPAIEYNLHTARLISFLVMKNIDEKKGIAAAREAIEDSRKPKAKPTVTNSSDVKRQQSPS